LLSLGKTMGLDTALALKVLYLALRKTVKFLCYLSWLELI